MLIRSRQTVGDLALPSAIVATKECADLTPNQFVRRRIREVAPKSPDVMRPIAATVVATMHSMSASDSAMVPKWIAWHERRHHPSSRIGTSATRRRHRCRRTETGRYRNLVFHFPQFGGSNSAVPTNGSADLVRSSSEIGFHHRYKVYAMLSALRQRSSKRE
jgi:hypothetical protein